MDEIKDENATFNNFLEAAKNCNYQKLLDDLNENVAKLRDF